MRFRASAVADRLASIADYLGLADRSAEGVIAEVERLLGVFEAPRRLQDIGVPQDALAEAAAHAMDDWAITAGPRVPDPQDVRDLLQGAW
jgi:alcohol dehydrogenase class IV